MEGPGAVAGTRRPGGVSALPRKPVQDGDAERAWLWVCSEEARQAEAQRTERQRRMQLQHEEQLAKERAMAPEANPLCAPAPSLTFI